MASSQTPSSSRRRRDEVESVGRFQRLEQIGKGSFALVYRGIHIRKRTIVAIKSVHLSKLNKKLKDNLVSEIRILQSLHHPHIVALIDCIERESMMHLVMEYCEIGDLSMFIKSHLKMVDEPITLGMFHKYPSSSVGGLNEVIARHFTKQIGSAMEFIRAKNYLHRDIKPQNLLLNPSPLYYARNKPDIMPYQVTENSLVPAAGVDSLPMLKIADFGFARHLNKTSLAETLCGSPLYMAPEILRYEKYNAKADLWSIGTVLYEMMFAKAPFRAGNHVELLRKIENQNDVIRFSSSVTISDDMRNLIEALLKKSPLERVGFDRFFDHPIIKGPIPGLVGEDRPSESSIELQSSRPKPRLQPGKSQSAQARDSPFEEMDQLESPLPMRTPPGRSSRPATSRDPGSPLAADQRRDSADAEASEPISREARRPPITSHTTAPARPQQIQDRTPVAGHGQLERRLSKRQTSPRTSVLKDQMERDRAARAAEDRVAKEVSDQAAQDVAFERDYVLVEKRAVEVNAFADEMNNAPQQRAQTLPRIENTTMARRATTQAIPMAGAASKGRSISTTSPTNRPRTEIAHRTGSYERRFGLPHPSSATSVISKALKGANLRVFGTSISPPNIKGLSPPKGYGAFPTYPVPQSSLTFVGDKALETRDEDMRTVYIVEELASRSDVVYGFAEVKYQQLLPTPPSQGQGLGIAQADPSLENPEDDDDLTMDAVVTISEEALVLFVKALAILAKAIDHAGSWWRYKGEAAQQDATAIARTSPTSGGRGARLTIIQDRMNLVVQWCRNRFNECLEKSEFVGRKLVDAQKNLPVDHPGHPSNHPVAASTGSSSGTSIGTSAENITLTSGVTAEKLMYERAVELSRAAAVKELVGEDLPGCEIGYVTAVRMLEAILEEDADPLTSSSRKGSSGGKKELKEDEPVNGLETEDRQTVHKLVDTMRQRLSALKRKLEFQRASKRPSSIGS